ncbi:uncharacterized Fe-S center protein [Acetomicrobium mobile DSM 13181]|uniref:Uncharacterized Fe-S center protein n=1 Tax=Acetomicrobium mobile (strain ATCC BAA-54 / DSM 13181 / JCM 12221 / NGA) TaxID=891968 RepID=I4BZ73_ACEMN|nr:DUF362 domain-containing protein [Acetomicrobium mobile]AFM22580.1 uncharacterized Fe-S center protein [Acetomicrobium mobile DSM 13181]
MSVVNFVGARERCSSSRLLERFKGTLKKGELQGLFSQGELVAVKFEAGERDNLRYVRPLLVKAVVDVVYSLGGQPLLVDTLSMGSKASEVGRRWLEAVTLHGFDVTSLGKSPMLADGYTGEEEMLVQVDGEELGGVEIARAVAESQALVVISHVTAHPFAGLSGALVSCGVGCASFRGKERIHAPLRPLFVEDRCDGCGQCEKHCPHDAVRLKDDRPSLDDKRCKGCAYYCTAACPVGAVVIDGRMARRFQRRVVDSALAVTGALQGKVYYVNILMDVCPYPDCYPFSDVPFVSDRGILMSHDPVALDSATLNVLDESSGIWDSIAEESESLGSSDDKLLRITGVDPTSMIAYAKKLGMGSDSFEIRKA